MSSSPEERLEKEIIERYRAAGIVLPPEWSKGAIATAANLLNMSYRLRTPRTAADQPAFSYSLAPKDTK